MTGSRSRRCSAPERPRSSPEQASRSQHVLQRSLDDIPAADIVAGVSPGDPRPDADALGGLGRYAGPATLILASLAGGEKHGYALTRDIADFAGVKLAPGTLYEARARLERQGLITPLESDDRRRPDRLTAAGAAALQAQLDEQRRVADVGLRRLELGGLRA